MLSCSGRAPGAAARQPRSQRGGHSGGGRRSQSRVGAGFPCVPVRVRVLGVRAFPVLAPGRAEAVPVRPGVPPSTRQTGTVRGEMSPPHHGDRKKSTAIDRHSHVCLHSWSLGVRTVRCLLPELECKHQFFRGGCVVNLVGFVFVCVVILIWVALMWRRF